jgi:hypothetical protein
MSSMELNIIISIIDNQGINLLLNCLYSIFSDFIKFKVIFCWENISLSYNSIPPIALIYVLAFCSLHIDKTLF